jgi:hypothetical protein
VYLPPEARAFVLATNAGTARILSASYTAQHIEATVATPVPTMLVAAQTYYYPWHAYVDGQPVRLWRANYAFQAVVIPAGAHQVRLVYEDRRFNFGAVVSLATLAGCGIFFFRRGRRRAGLIKNSSALFASSNRSVTNLLPSAKPLLPCLRPLRTNMIQPWVLIQPAAVPPAFLP